MTLLTAGLAAATGLAGCGGDTTTSSTGPASSLETTSLAPTTAPPATASTTAPPTSTTTMPLDFRRALTVRLGDELGDDTLAAAVVAGFDDDVLGQIEQAVGGDVTSPALAFRPPTVDGGEVDSLLVFAFGNRVATDGTLLPGPTNEALADVTAAFIAEHPVPVFAQWEVADLLVARGVPNVVSIEPDIGDDGAVVYLSTAGVAAKAVDLAAEAGVDLGHVGVIGHADHAVRCVMNARTAGMTADVPAGVDLPSDYDSESGQPWTRDRQSYVATDLLGRLLAGS